MASSNRHWPSLFKSKPSCAAATNHQWHHDIDHIPLLNPNSYSSGVHEERTPEPKPRWNPKPEQIRILEAIFNSGMVNPPRDEIRRIRTQLQVYGQVGDANVFYWFQNRKSRSKHKQRQLKSVGAGGSASPSSAAVSAVTVPAATSTSSSSSGLDKLQCGPPVSTAAAVLAALFDLPPSPAQSPIFLRPELSLEAPFLTPASYPHATGGPSESPAPGGLDIAVKGVVAGKNGVGEEEEELRMLGLLESVAESAASCAGGTGKSAINARSSDVSEIQVLWSMVFINDVAYEVMAGPLNLREAFGPDAVLLHSSGHPVLTDDWGLTLQPLQHGASYYLV